jgi:DNA (cytosine-5)-methyltransferase 1
MAKRKITQLDLFSGIGGFHLGFERAGYEVESYFSEIDKHAVAVYKHRFKNSTYVGSVTDVRGAELPRIDLITFGSPCQDFSLAGKRKGLSGDRSGLITEAIRLIRECRPSVFIWENVKGSFSSNDGEDFAAILQEFTNIGGYRLEWQLLNTSWVLPQNRERIYLVGYSTTPGGDWRGVFPIRESYQSNSKLERSRKAVTKCLTARGQEGHAGMQLIQVKSATSKGYEDIEIGDIRYDEGGFRPRKNGIAPALVGSNSKSGTPNCSILKIKSATKKGYEEAQEGDSINLSQPNSETRRGRVGKGKAQTLETSCNQAVVEPTTCRGGLQKNAAHFEEKSPALTSAMGMGGGHTPIVDQPNYRIRRLTPIECERLQGFPDNHTEYGNYDGEVKKMSNTQRYKQCGNAVTVDIVALVAEAIKPLLNRTV